MIKHIKNTCDNWSATNDTLGNNYLQIFVKFVKSIDFHTCNDILLYKMDLRECMLIFSAVNLELKTSFLML